MPIELTKSFAPQDYAEALESWAWVGLERKTPIVSSLFGDVIFEAGDGYWFLDTVAGKLERAWPDKRSLDAELATPAGKSHYLLGDLALAADASGLRLGQDQVFRLQPPAGARRRLGRDEPLPMSFTVCVDIAGQLHEQVRNLPPGTKVSGATLTPVDRGKVGASPRQRRWGRR